MRRVVPVFVLLALAASGCSDSDRSSGMLDQRWTVSMSMQSSNSSEPVYPVPVQVTASFRGADPLLAAQPADGTPVSFRCSSTVFENGAHVFDTVATQGVARATLVLPGDGAHVVVVEIEGQAASFTCSIGGG